MNTGARLSKIPGVYPVTAQAVWGRRIDYPTQDCRTAPASRLAGKRIEHVSRIDAELSGYIAGVPILAPAQRPLCASGISGACTPQIDRLI